MMNSRDVNNRNTHNERSAAGAFIAPIPGRSTFTSALSSPSSSSFCPSCKKNNKITNRTCKNTNIVIGTNHQRAHVIRRRQAPRQLVQHVSTMAEIIGQFILSCGVGFAGIVGNKATERARLVIGGERRAEAMEKLALEIDSFRRRKELAEGAAVVLKENENDKNQTSNVELERDWVDVGVDKLSNVVVVPEDVPLLGVNDELLKFDSLLGLEGTRFLKQNNRKSDSEDSIGRKGKTIQLPEASEFVLDDDFD